MADELVRFSVAVPEDLLRSFDSLVERRGLARNRSEALRDLIRAALVEDECAQPDAQIMGTLTIVYDHHTTDLKEKLDSIQHRHFENVVATMHVHLDRHTCLENIVLRGRADLVRNIADCILGTKGVVTGKLVQTAIGGGQGGHGDGCKPEHGRVHACGPGHSHGGEHGAGSDGAAEGAR